jgi:hypothetical protein
VKLNRRLPDNLPPTAAPAAPAGVGQAPARRRRGARLTMTTTTILEPTHFTSPQCSQDSLEDKWYATPCDQARATRERFRAQHGLGADRPQRQVLSKAQRKALRAAEMARWECGHAVPSTTPGLGIWTEAMFMKAMRTGRHMSVSRDILPPTPWQNLAALTDDDLRAVYAHLRPIPPVANQVPDPVPPGGPPGFD